MELAGERKLDLLRNIAEWGDSWLVTFNATKTKLLSFNCDCDTLDAGGDEWHLVARDWFFICLA